MSLGEVASRMGPARLRGRDWNEPAGIVERMPCSRVYQVDGFRQDVGFLSDRQRDPPCSLVEKVGVCRVELTPELTPHVQHATQIVAISERGAAAQLQVVG